MNQTGTAWVCALALAVLSAFAGASVPAAWRARAVGVLLAACGGAGVWAGASATAGRQWYAHLPDLIPLGGVRLGLDALSGWFVLLVGAVTAIAGVYAIGYAGRDGRGPAARSAMVVLPLFCAAMLAVPAAANVVTLLWCWELMAVTSLLLVLTEHRHSSQALAAAKWYAAMTQAGFVSLLIGLVWLASATGGGFAEIREGRAAISPAVQGAIFLLCLAGFASKAGAVPLHPWLPRAHAEAPSHVSALMSAAMVKLGIYGVLRIGFDLLGGGARWWWLVVAALGALSALYGILQAAVATDLKRLLAFSTSENVGLILLGIGFAGMYAASARGALAGAALTAALLHTLNHAGFKALLFLGAGSVVRATETRGLDKLGGLSKRMPATAALVAVGALAAAALPPGNGFVSEWLLLQSLVQPADAGTVLAIAAPVAVAVIALTAGVAVATFTKAVGTGFLARPRSAAAEAAVESPVSMLTAMAAAAAGCAVLAVVPSVTLPAIGAVAGQLQVGVPIAGQDIGSVQLVGVTGRFWPLWLAVAIGGGVLAVGAAARLLGRRRRRAIAWDCGDGPLTARMEYTATSYAEPLQRVFDDALAPERDVDITHDAESAYVVEAVRFRQRIPDRIENRLYQPVIAAIGRLGVAARRLAPGTVHRYLAYMLAALVAVLIVGVV